MGEVSRQQPTVPAPTSLQAAAGDGMVDWRTDPAPGVGASDDGRRWHRSWSYRTTACRPIVAGPGGCRPGDPRDWDAQRPLIFTGVPFGFEAQLECSVPADGADLGAEARAAFDRGASAAVATELYRGAQARAMIDDNSEAAEGNRWLTRSDDPVSPLVDDLASGPMPLVGALGILESYLACCSDVGRGVIHLPNSLLPAALGSGLIEPTTPTGRRYTAGGHLVISDCGYTGEAPGTAAQGPQDPEDGALWVYATGPLVVRVSPTLDLSSDEDVAALIATTNDRVAVSQGLAMVAWGCCHAGVPVDVTPYGLDLAD